LTLLKGLSLPTSTPDDHPRLKGLTPPFKAQLRQKSKELLIEEEVQRRRCVYCRHENMAVFDGMLDRRAIKMNLANEGFEARKKEEEVTARKRKAEDDARWEGNCINSRTDLPSNSHACPTETREQRVGSWRTFTNTSKKKKKQKGDVLG
jgi:DnaJ family protein C protein 8